MTTQLREDIDQSKAEVNLSGAVECDDVYATAGYKGNPAEIKKGRQGRRNWLRPHRGISQEKLPLYLSFFEFVHNAKRRGKALLSALLDSLLSLPPRNTY